MYRIGIITNNNTLFSNGLSQNAYFLYEVFRLGGHKCTMLCYDANYTKLEGLDVPVKTIYVNGFDLTQYDIIITVASGISKEMYERREKTVILGFVCGNILANNLIDFISEDEDGGSRIIKKTQPIDMLWIIGGFDYMNRYVELMRGAPAISVPHLWSPLILEKQALDKFKYHPKDLHFNPELHTNRKLNILILEPNIGFTKTGLLPLLACEALFLKNPDLIDTVYLFNVPKGGAAATIIDNLAVNSKVRRFKGLHMAEIISHFNKQESMPLVLCHQILHPWNYVYYEMMYYGIPLVHNSDKMKGYGYHYSGCDIDGAVSAIVQAQTYHSKLCSVQKKKSDTFLKTINPYDPDTVNVWNKLLEATKIATEHQA